MRGVFVVEHSDGPRWVLALDLLQRGEAFSLGRITFRRKDVSTVEASVASSWSLANVTEEYAADDLRKARQEVELLLANDGAFRSSIGESSIDFVLVDDYDTGSVAVCRLLGDGELEWLT